MNSVYVVHCIDTEGPLNESLEATFERIKHIYHLDLKPSNHLLKDLQQGKVDLGGLEDSVKNTLNPHFLDYNNSWHKIEKMLSSCLSSEFRSKFIDSVDNNWIYNWHCVDHVDFEVNPRSREIGYHAIFDKYSKYILNKDSKKDGLHFHYHPHPIKKFAHLCATRWIGPTDKLFQVLSRRIIDREWFPCVNRPGFQVTRPDSHWFLEQFIPFDYASLSKKPEDEDKNQFDLSAGRSGDWRRAPITWQPYNPSHDDYQVPGNCNRIIARSLNIGTRFCNIDQDEMDLAFKEAQESKNVLVSFADHDFRDLRKDVHQAYSYLVNSKKKYKDINFVFCEAVEGMRKAMNIRYQEKCTLDLDIKKINEKTHVLEINSSGEIFGPQPYLAIKTRDQNYHHDNLDFQIPKRKWTYTFDEETLQLNEVEKIGVAANNSYGITSISIFDVMKGKVSHKFLNL